MAKLVCRRTRAIGRIAAGFAVAPLLPAVIYGLMITLFSQDPEAGKFVAVVMTYSGYAAILLLGVPLFYVWRRRRWLSVEGLIGLGALSAALFTLVVVAHEVVVGAGPYDVQWFLHTTLILTLAVPAGMAAGFALWWVGVRTDTDE